MAACCLLWEEEEGEAACWGADLDTSQISQTVRSGWLTNEHCGHAQPLGWWSAATSGEPAGGSCWGLTTASVPLGVWHMMQAECFSSFQKEQA